MYKYIKGIIASCLELLYPKRCACCDKVLLKIEKDVGFCKACAKNVKLVGDSYCMKCGCPLTDNSKELCQNCKETNHGFDKHKAVFRYEKYMKQAIYKFKYANRRCLGKVFAKHAVKSYGGWLDLINVDAIVPVPMYKPKEKRRGYNQAAVFAKALSEETGIPVYDKIVRRKRDTVAMKQLNKLKRKKNLLKSFTLEENVVQFRKVLIVDDIYTTGTTMDEVARLLKRGGVKEVYGMSICIGSVQ